MPISAAENQRIEAERIRVAESRRRREQDLDGHVQAIRAARGDLEAKLGELQGHCEQLLRTARLARYDGADDARYRIYQTAQSRLAGAIGEALKRARSTDRLIDASHAERQDQERREREESLNARVKTAVQEVFDLQLPREHDFEELFGGAEVTSAS